MSLATIHRKINLNLMKNKLPQQRWRIKEYDQTKIDEYVKKLEISPIIAQILLNREVNTLEKAEIYLDPSLQNLPNPAQEFKDLAKSLKLLRTAITDGKKIAICGDYDADGMTSTALLITALRHLKANVDYAIPSRMTDGYGINNRIVEEFAQENVSLILTVDNGISAYLAIAKAKELGMNVIITDHHDLPEILPPADAILNPKLLDKISPYYGLAGVGVAYLLAISLAEELGELEAISNPALELFTLGTIADLAPLIGINRTWLKKGLKLLPKSQLQGIKALIFVSGVDDTKKQLNPDDIGFRLGPKINALGRIGNPQIIIDLLTTVDEGFALQKAMECEQVNKTRQQIGEEILTQAIKLIEETPINWKENRVIFVISKNWHHGVIGIVASKLVDKYNVPVFIATYEGENCETIRGSARSIEEFNVFDALNYCDDLLLKYGGHKAAGGFSLAFENINLFEKKLIEFAHNCVKIEHLKPLIKIDSQLTFDQINFDLFKQLEHLQPWGISNSNPIFFSTNIKILEQKITRRGTDITLNLADQNGHNLKAIAWRWNDYFPLPKVIDIAYKLKENDFNGIKSIQLELVGARNFEPNLPLNRYYFEYQNREYICSFSRQNNELKLINNQGKKLSLFLTENTAYLDEQKIDISTSFYQKLIDQAKSLLQENSVY